MREVFLRSSKIPECQALHIHISTATHPCGLLYNTIYNQSEYIRMAGISHTHNFYAPNGYRISNESLKDMKMDK